MCGYAIIERDIRIEQIDTRIKFNQKFQFKLSLK